MPLNFILYTQNYLTNSIKIYMAKDSCKLCNIAVNIIGGGEIPCPFEDNILGREERQ